MLAVGKLNSPKVNFLSYYKLTLGGCYSDWRGASELCKHSLPPSRFPSHGAGEAEPWDARSNLDYAGSCEMQTQQFLCFLPASPAGRQTQQAGSRHKHARP